MPKRLSVRWVVLTCLVFFFWYALTTILYFPDWHASTIEYCCGRDLSLQASLAELVEYFGGADAASYARGGLLLSETGTPVPPGSAPTWSPGMFWLYGALIVFLGVDGPVVAAVVQINMILWALFLSLISLVARSLAPRNPLAGFLPGIMFALPFVGKYLFSWGVFYSENISIALFGISVTLFFKASIEKHTLTALLGALFFVLAAYFKEIFEIAGSAFVIFSLFTYFIYIKNKDRFPLNNKHTFGIKTAMIVALIFAFSTCVYRISNWINYGSPQWTFTKYYFSYSWTPDEEYTPNAGFVLNGGGNIACKVDQNKCRYFIDRRARDGHGSVDFREYFQETLKALGRHPVEWVQLKIPIIRDYFAQALSVKTGWAPFVVGLLFLCAAILLCFIIFIKFGYFLPVAAYFSFVSSNLLTLILIHIETRYLYPIIVITLLVTILASLVVLSKKSSAQCR